MEQKAVDVKLFSREELKSRNSRDDAVLIIHNSVYDVTSFLLEVSHLTLPAQLSTTEQFNILPIHSYNYNWWSHYKYKFIQNESC